MTTKREGNEHGEITSTDWTKTGGGTATETRAADHVFLQLAGAILRGQLAAAADAPDHGSVWPRQYVSGTVTPPATGT